MAVDEGLGATLTLSTSNFESSAKIISITPDPITREVYNTSYLGTTSFHTKQAADLMDPGGITIEFFHEGAEPPQTATAETITVTYPGADTMSASGVCDSYTPPSAQVGQPMIASAHFTFLGTVTFA
jgi:hypothetical protein